MNPSTITVIVAAWVISISAVGGWQHSKGWKEGRQNLVQQQQEKAQAQLAKQTTRQQANDTKAAAADEAGKAETVTITQQVIKYVQTPGRNTCVFDDTRVQLKSRAVDNANTIPGYDDAAVQTSPAVRQR